MIETIDSIPNSVISPEEAADRQRARGGKVPENGYRPVFERFRASVVRRHIDRVKAFIEAGWRIVPDEHKLFLGGNRDRPDGRLVLKFTTEMIDAEEPEYAKLTDQCDNPEAARRQQ